MKFIKSISILLLILCMGQNALALDGGKKKKKDKTKTELSEKEEIRLKSIFLEANKEKMLNNSLRALELFEVCLSIDPNHAASHFEIASLRIQMKQASLALEHMKKAAEIDPSNKWYVQSLAIMYEQLKMYANGIQVYNQLIEMNPREISYYENLANMYLYQNDLKGALKIYDRIEEEFGVLEFSSTQKQKIYINLGKVDKAIEEAQKLIDSAPGTPKYYTGLAELYSSSGQQEKAIETYQKLLEIDPDNAYVQLSMSVYYYDGGQMKEAKEAMCQAFANPTLDFNTKARILFNDIAYRDVARGQVNPFGLELADILEKTHPDNAKSYAANADLLYQSGQQDKALEAYERSLKVDENQFIIWSQIMLLYSERSQWDSIYNKSEIAMELFPSQPSMFYFNGIAAIQLKKYQDAIDALEIGKDFVIDNNNLLGQFYTNLGDAYHSLEKHDQSDDNFDKALRLNPEDDLVLNNYSYYLSLRGEKLDKANTMAKKVVDRNPNSATYLDTYAWVLYKQGNFPEAKKYMEKAIDSSPEEEGTLLEHYGDILFQLGEQESAIRQWQRAKEIGGGSEFLDKKLETKQLHE